MYMTNVSKLLLLLLLLLDSWLCNALSWLLLLLLSPAAAAAGCARARTLTCRTPLA
jgi:hypothetical protein